MDKRTTSTTCGSTARDRAKRAPAATASGGFAMIEVLVALIILLLGLLGLVGVMIRANTAELESYQRVQAVILAQDMLNRVNANRAVAACYSNNATTAAPLGTNYAGTPTCTLGNAQQNAQAIADLKAWNAMLLGSAETTAAGSKVGAMIGARGCVQLIDAVNTVYMVSVVWQGMNATAAPVDACGKGQYGGDDRLRRDVTITLRIGNLT